MIGQVMIILCGPPGVGKTTTAKLLLGPDMDENVCEADEWFRLSEAQKHVHRLDKNEVFFRHGEYQYVREEISQAHQFCQQKAKVIMEHGEPLVIANTSSSRGEKNTYIQLAAKYKYNVVVLVVDKHHHGYNDKGLSRKIVDSFYSRFEFLDRGYQPADNWKTK